MHHIIELKNQRGEVFFDKLKFVYLELPKFKKKEDEISSHFEKWLYVLRHLSKLQNRPKAFQEKIFKQLFEAAEIAKYSLEEQAAYEASLKYYRDIKNVVDTSHEEGVEIGIDRTVKNGIEKGYSDDIISDISGRTIDYVQKIREQLKNSTDS